MRKIIFVIITIAIHALSGYSQFTLTDNEDYSENGVKRKVTIVSKNQIEISFTAYLQASVDFIYDLVNDPQRNVVLNDIGLLAQKVKCIQ